jgi:hypothetical protein
MNYPNFPLYESLKNDEFKELTDDEKDALINKIKVMNDDKQEIVYALMKAYYIEEQETLSNELPYNGKELKNRIKFDLDQIPSKLQYILKCFSLID